jgi:hypothetical protein
MKKYLLLLFVFLSTLLFSSCFEILEELQLNDNGTGTFSLTINMSESKVKLNSMMMLDSFQGHKIPKKADIQKQLSHIRNKVNNILGISATQTNFDHNEYVGNIKFNFTNVQQVHTAMKVIMDEYKIANYSIPNYQYHTQSKTLSRTFTTQAKTIAQYNKLKKEDKEIFQKAKFTSIFRFNKEVSTSNNALSKISKNRKAVMQQTNLHSIITNTTQINNNITLDK